jgi:hypothetical protein
MSDKGTNNTHVGQCIYCRALPTADDPLSDEHIFPFGIFGQQKLLKASCKKCAVITSNFERQVQKDDMGALRYALGFPSRRKGKRKNIFLPIEIVTHTDEVKTIHVPLEEYVPIMALPVFPQPAHESKEPYEKGITLTGYVSNPSVRSAAALAKKYGAKEIAVYTLRWPEAWARMFAKIAYALAVKEYGLELLKLEDVYVIPAILGQTNDIGRWVGCVEEQVYDAETFRDQIAGLWVRDGEIHAVIKLFGWLNTVPEYQVIVGRLSSAK